MAGASGRIVWAAAAALVAAACIAVAATPEARSAARGKCEEETGKTIAANEQVRAFASEGVLYASAAGPRRLFVLGDYTSEVCDSPTCDLRSIGQVELGGRYVAYSDDEQTRDTGTSAIYLLDTKRARRRRVWREGSFMESVGTAALLVTPRGGVAWIATRRRTGVPVPGTTRVFKANAGAGPELLDEGQGIETGSLALSESQRTVYWTTSGQPRSAPIK